MVSGYQSNGGRRRGSYSYHVDEGGDEEEQDGEDSHQGAVHSGLDNLLGQRLQGSWENLGRSR